MIIDIYLSKAGYEMKNYADRSVRPRWITDSEICAILRIILRPNLYYCFIDSKNEMEYVKVSKRSRRKKVSF